MSDAEKLMRLAAMEKEFRLAAERAIFEEWDPERANAEMAEELLRVSTETSQRVDRSALWFAAGMVVGLLIGALL